MLATCDHCGGDQILLVTVFRRKGGDVTNWWECQECGEYTIEERNDEASQAYKGSPKDT